MAAQEEIAIAPIKIVDARGRECERGARSRRVGQSPTRVRFEDESEKEAERRYLERVRQRGPVVTDKSQNSAAANKSEQSRGISMAAIRKEDEGAQAIIPQEEVVGKCDACGSLLGIIIAKDAHGQPVLSTADGRGTFVHTWVSPSLIDQPQSCDAGNADLSGGAALADSVGGAGAGEGGAGEQMSGFGKLRRRSLKGERRDDAGHVLGPYARSQDLWAQRRNSYSKMRASMEDGGNLLYAQRVPTPPQGVTFAVDMQSMLGHSTAGCGTSGILKDTSSPQLPLKSALKSSSKNQSSGQRVLTLMPSVQYRLVHLDQDKEGKPHHIELSADEQLTVTAGTSSTGLTPCIKQSSLRSTNAKMTSDLPPQGLWETSSEAVTGMSLFCLISINLFAPFLHMILVVPQILPFNANVEVHTCYAVIVNYSICWWAAVTTVSSHMRRWFTEGQFCSDDTGHDIEAGRRLSWFLLFHPQLFWPERTLQVPVHR